MKVSKIRKELLLSIVVPISVCNSDIFNQRNKNLKTKHSITNEDFLNTLNEKQVNSGSKQIDKRTQMVQDRVKSMNFNELSGIHENEVMNKVSDYSYIIKPIKSCSQILEEKANIAEKYLQNLGNELLQIRNLIPKDRTQQFHTSSVTSSSLTEKKHKEAKIKRREKRVISDIKQLTLNLMQLEAQINRKNKKRKCKSFKKKRESLLGIETTPKHIQQDTQQSVKNLTTGERVVECDNYFNQFENYKIRQEFEFNDKSKIPSSLNCKDINKTNNIKAIRRLKSIRNKTKIKRKSTKDFGEKFFYFDRNKIGTISECNQTISDDDFNTFFQCI